MGSCRGPCTASEDDCQPSEFATHVLKDGTTVRVVKKCECKGCRAVRDFTAIKVPNGRCEGSCAGSGQTLTCLAGRKDNFDQSNQPEPSYPSVALISGVLGMCSSGIVPGFDEFAQNKCFGHTFGKECLVRDAPCPLKRAKLELCLRPTPNSWSNTDSLGLGSGGVVYWHRLMSDLSRPWIAPFEFCTTFDLDNLAAPTGSISLLSLVDATGQLDFFVQDDTAVDFLELTVEYEACARCMPSEVSVSTLYTADGVKDIEDVRGCSCAGVSACRRYPLHKTFFPNTAFQQTIDVGTCDGSCPKGRFCRAREITRKEIAAPEGKRTVPIIQSCGCGVPITDTATGAVAFKHD